MAKLKSLPPYGVGFWTALVVAAGMYGLLGYILYLMVSIGDSVGGEYLLSFLVLVVVLLRQVRWAGVHIKAWAWESQVAVPPLKMAVYTATGRFGQQFFMSELHDFQKRNGELEGVRLYSGIIALAALAVAVGAVWYFAVNISPTL
jgi:hypothetical protein